MVEYFDGVDRRERYFQVAGQAVSTATGYDSQCYVASCYATNHVVDTSVATHGDQGVIAPLFHGVFGKFGAMVDMLGIGDGIVYECVVQMLLQQFLDLPLFAYS